MIILGTLALLGLLGGAANARAERRTAREKEEADAERDSRQSRSRTASERRARKERAEQEEQRKAERRAEQRRQQKQRDAQEARQAQRERLRELNRTKGTRQRMAFWRKKKGQVFAFSTGRKSFVARIVAIEEDGLVVRDGAKTEGHVGFKDLTVCPLPAAALKDAACWLFPRGGGGEGEVVDLDDA